MKSLLNTGEPDLAKLNLRNLYTDSLNKIIKNSPRLKFYEKFCEPDYQIPFYLSLENPEFRWANTRFRISAHKLGVLTSKYKNNNTANDGNCSSCKVMEDESHVLLECPKYSTLRANLFNKVDEVLGHDLFLLSDRHLINLLMNTNNRGLSNEVGFFLKGISYKPKSESQITSNLQNDHT